jgi:hypothetical protein
MNTEEFLPDEDVLECIKNLNPEERHNLRIMTALLCEREEDEEEIQIHAYRQYNDYLSKSLKYILVYDQAELSFYDTAEEAMADLPNEIYELSSCDVYHVRNGEAFACFIFVNIVELREIEIE